MKEALKELEKDFRESVNKIDFEKYDPYSKIFMKPLFIGMLYVAMKEVMESDVEEELDGARKYWTAYLDTDDITFKEMASDELRHAGILIKKHLASADETRKAELNSLEKERQDMLKVIKEE